MMRKDMALKMGWKMNIKKAMKKKVLNFQLTVRILCATEINVGSEDGAGRVGEVAWRRNNLNWAVIGNKQRHGTLRQGSNTLLCQHRLSEFVSKG
jgi:hypothetical protein